MAVAALRLRRSLTLLRAFSTSSSATFTGRASGLATRPSSTRSPFVHNNLSGFSQPWPASRHLLARCRNSESLNLAEYKWWLCVLEFPKDPKPTREEMIETYVKTLAAVLGSEEEAKKKIYALSTTTYTGFQANIDEATSNKLKGQPGVTWVLPDGYGDPANGFFAGDRYENGVITPNPRPPWNNSTERQRNNDRPRFERRDRQRDGMQRERRDFRPMEGRENMQGEGRDFRPREGPMQGEQRDYRPPIEGRNPMQGEQRDYRPPIERRDPVQGERSMPPFERKDSSVQTEQRYSMQGE